MTNRRIDPLTSDPPAPPQQIESILAGNKEVCLNINIGWDHINEDRLYGDMLVEQSEDDELDNAVSTHQGTRHSGNQGN